MPNVLQEVRSEARPSQILVFLKEWSAEQGDQNSLGSLINMQILGSNLDQVIMGSGA